MPNLRSPLVRRQAVSDDDDDAQQSASTPAPKRPRFSDTRASNKNGNAPRRAASTSSKENSARRITTKKNDEESDTDSVTVQVPMKRPQRSTAPPIDYTEERPPNIRARHKSVPRRPEQRRRSVHRATVGGAHESHLNGSTAMHTDIAGPSSIKKTSNTNTKVTKHVAKQHSVGVELDAAEDQCHAALEITECGDANGEKADADEHLEDTQEDDLVWPADEECFLCEIFVTRELQDFQAIIDDCEEAMWANAEDDDTADVSGMAGEEASWEVEKILFIDRKESNTALVKWRDWNYKPDYWEALENLTGCEDLFDDYKRRLKLNTAIAATLKFNDRLFWPDLWESPAFLRCHEWEDEIGCKSVEAGYAPLYVENWVDKEPRPKKFEVCTR
ncbi:hypothetical protein AAVH_09391 [Aphelenchoides avenae]|nr:hypothetical protein AAVH_09391 [Aphelenchus avenae]